MTPSYIYKAKLERVVDGDTIVVTLDLGCYTYIRKRIRLADCHMPELSTPEGQEAKAWLINRLNLADIVIATERDKVDKYARLLGTIYIGAANINEELTNIFGVIPK